MFFLLKNIKKGIFCFSFLFLNVYVIACDNINIKNFGAKGDGTTDDTNAIQSAINYAQTTNSPLYFPSGTYLVTSLDFGNWANFAIFGNGAGSAGISSYNGLSIIISKNANTSVAFDFSGSAYGTVRDIAFIADSTVNCCLLLARTTGNSSSNYGSDIVFNSCNFTLLGGGVGKAVIVDHSGEVITFEDCRIQYNATPAFVFTSRASSYWGVTSAHHQAIPSSECSLTLLRFYGGEIVGNNAMAIVLDGDSALGRGGGDITINGCYGGVSGNNSYFLQALTGSWDNISIQSTRVEIAYPGSSNYGGINLANNSSLLNVDIQMDVTTGNFIAGNGSIFSGFLNSAAPINITSGTLGSLILATFNPINITCPNIQNCKVMNPSGSIAKLSASTKLELDDGNGGLIVSAQPLYQPGSVTYYFPSQGDPTGLYICSYSGASLGIWYTMMGGVPSAMKIWDASPVGVGILHTGTLTGAQSNFKVTATFNNNGDYLIIRRLSPGLFVN